MTKHQRVSVLVSVIASALLAVTSIGVAAQDEAQPVTVAEISGDAYPVSSTVTIDGIAIQSKFAPYDWQYFFSDGTGITIIDPDSAVPLQAPINIVGHQVGRNEIEVTGWTELDGPMEGLGPREEAFLAWVALLDEDIDDMDDED